MTLQSKKLRCNSCGGDLEVQSPQARSVVCSYCDAQIDLTSADYGFLRSVQRPDYGPYQPPLTIGLMLTKGDGVWRVGGHIRFASTDPTDPYFWDEFMLVHQETGQTQWLQYDDGNYALYTPRRLRAPLDPNQNQWQVDGVHYYVNERGRARIHSMNGELSWSAKRGDIVQWADTGKVGAEWTDKELEVYDKIRIEPQQLASALGVTYGELMQRSYRIHYPDSGDGFAASAAIEDSAKNAGIAFLIIVVVFVLIFGGCICSSCRRASRGYGPVNSGPRYGPSYSPSYRRGSRSGGGFSFGK